MSFVKLHGSILDSSVWAEPHATRIVWITMLAMADQDGIVGASVGGLARRAAVSVEEARTALTTFLSPEPDSRDGTTGERLSKVPGGWLVLNHAQYREKRTDTQIATAERVAKHRAKVRASRAVTAGNVTSLPVTEDNACAVSASVQSASSGTGESAERGKSKYAERPDDVSQEVWDAYLPVRRGKRITHLALKGIRREAEKAGWTLDAALQKCAERNWQGFEAEWVAGGGRGGATKKPPSFDSMGKVDYGASGAI
jgi:hypothetical protein